MQGASTSHNMLHGDVATRALGPFQGCEELRKLILTVLTECIAHDGRVPCGCRIPRDPKTSQREKK